MLRLTQLLVAALLVLSFDEATALAQSAKVGDRVFLKENASVTRNKQPVDHVFIRVPATIEAVNGKWLWIGRGWVNERDVLTPDEAFAFSSQLVEKQPESAAAWANRGIARLAQGDAERAIIDLDKALDLEPGQPRWLAQRADAYSALGLHDVAEQDYRSAVAKAITSRVVTAAPDSAAVSVAAGDALVRQKKYAEAMVYYSTVLQLDATNPFTYAGLGDAFLGLEKHEQAVTAYTNALRYDSSLAPAYLHRGEAQLALREYSAAAKDFARALHFAPESLDAHLHLAQLYSSCPTASLRNAAGALKHAEQARVLSPAPRADVLSALASAYAESGDFVQAVAAQTQALALAPDDAKPAYQARLELYKSGQPYRESQQE